MEIRNEDRLSKLPNALIQRVLSFHPFKDVVSTGILSKRWRKVWVSTNVFDFRGWWRNYLDKAEGSCDHEMDPNDYLMAAKVFLGFVNRVLTVHDDNSDMPALQKCYLEIDQILFHRDTVKALVSTIERRQVEKLIFDNMMLLNVIILMMIVTRMRKAFMNIHLRSCIFLTVFSLVNHRQGWN